MALIDRPIIIIGAGRSGTSLLDAVLGAHPEIAMFGEFDGTVERLWQQFWQVSAAATLRSRRIAAIRRAEPEPDGASDTLIFERVRDLERQERQRVAGIIRHALDQLYSLTECPGRYWGFKEIWAETPDWQACDTVFPEALYLHIIRHPFDFARSSADWQRVAFTAVQLRADLAAWLGHLRANGARAGTGRYFRLTYEALLADPQAALAGVFARLGLGWDPACGGALARRYVPSGQASPLPPGIAASVAAVPGLAEALIELGYDLPAEPAARIVEGLARPGESATTAATRLGAGQWRLNPPFQADSGVAWTARLHMAPELAAFETQADTLEQPYRSPLILHEDGVPLGPAHSLHALIRGEGGGRFSHWGPQHILLFSATDGSDPNRNGRAYTIST
jgi:Sulfotransferase family